MCFPTKFRLHCSRVINHSNEKKIGANPTKLFSLLRNTFFPFVAVNLVHFIDNSFFWFVIVWLFQIATNNFLKHFLLISKQIISSKEKLTRIMPKKWVTLNYFSLEIRSNQNDQERYCLDQWFSTGVPRNPWVPQKALGVPPISELDWYLLVNCS
jgi:hypothetical protein